MGQAATAGEEAFSPNLHNQPDYGRGRRGGTGFASVNGRRGGTGKCDPAAAASCQFLLEWLRQPEGWLLATIIFGRDADSRRQPWLPRHGAWLMVRIALTAASFAGASGFLGAGVQSVARWEKNPH